MSDEKLKAWNKEFQEVLERGDMARALELKGLIEACLAIKIDEMRKTNNNEL